MRPPANNQRTLSCTLRARPRPWGGARSAAARAIMRAIVAVTGIGAKGTNAAQCGQAATYSCTPLGMIPVTRIGCSSTRPSRSLHVGHFTGPATTPPIRRAPRYAPPLSRSNWQEGTWARSAFVLDGRARSLFSRLFALTKARASKYRGRCWLGSELAERGNEHDRASITPASMHLCMASAFQQENATAMSSKHKTRPERRHNLDKRAAAHLRANPFLEETFWNPRSTGIRPWSSASLRGCGCSPASRDFAGITDPR